jgi:sporulation protein YlmC with PRC-barrel domain
MTCGSDHAGRASNEECLRQFFCAALWNPILFYLSKGKLRCSAASLSFLIKEQQIMANESERSTLTAGIGSGASIASGGARITGIDREDQLDAGPGPRIMAAATLEGDEVINGAGEKLGTIDEIMLDVSSGRVAYAVLAAGGFLGMGDKLFAIPWNALTLDVDKECFVLDVDKDRLENAPGFDKDHWPSMADQSWAQSVHSYYGTQPYWS